MHFLSLYVRVQEGVCFHLFTEFHYEQMADYQTPEILRTPLEEICLQLKVRTLISCLTCYSLISRNVGDKFTEVYFPVPLVIYPANIVWLV